MGRGLDKAGEEMKLITTLFDSHDNVWVRITTQNNRIRCLDIFLKDESQQVAGAFKMILDGSFYLLTEEEYEKLNDHKT